MRQTGSATLFETVFVAVVMILLQANDRGTVSYLLVLGGGHHTYYYCYLVLS